MPLHGLTRRHFLKALGATGLVGAATAAGCSDDAPEPSGATRRGGLDVTLFVTADTHFGFVDEDTGESNLPLLRSLIDTMNELPGTELPSEIGGGRVDEPLAVIVAGDLTEDGHRHEWEMFADHFGYNGRDGRLKYPVLETLGNHDRHFDNYVESMIATRQGGALWVRDMGDLRVVSLGEAPNDDDIAWFQNVLADTGTERPVLVALHYPIAGPYSTGGRGFSQGFSRWQLMRAVQGYNVVGMFHGHFHASGMYSLLGTDIYNVGAAKHGSNSFAVVRITDERMVVAEYNYLHQRWWWVHDKPINDATVDEAPPEPPVASVARGRIELFDMPSQQRPALIPYPILSQRAG